MHDTHRMLTLGVLLAGVLGAVGVESAWARWPWTRLRLARRLGVGILAGCIAEHVQWLVLSESLSPTKWHEAPVPAVARHIQQTPPDARGPVIELPFDRTGQFLSILAEPSVPRGNPLRAIDRPPIANTFWNWAYAAGKGGSIVDEPTQLEVRQSGVRWTCFDEDRCAAAAQSACAPSVHASLRRVLGVPERSVPLWVWKVGGSP